MDGEAFHCIYFVLQSASSVLSFHIQLRERQLFFLTVTNEGNEGVNVTHV